MTHRDQRDAERARIESLEEQLAEAQERAAAAEKRAQAAREAARAVEKRAAKAKQERAALEGENEALRRKERRARKRETSAEAAPAPAREGWSHEGQQRYFRGSLALAFVAYGGLLAYLVLRAGTDFERSMLVGAVASAVGLVVGHGVLGLVTRAPGAYSGATITLLTSSLSLGGMALLGSGMLTSDVLPEVLDKPVRALGVLAALLVGTFVTASWASDAAKSPIRPD